MVKEKENIEKGIGKTTGKWEGNVNKKTERGI